MKNSIVKNAVILTVIALILSCLLGVTNQLTKDKIADQELKAKQEAYMLVFPEAKEVKVNDDLTAKAAALPASSVVINEVVDAVDASGTVLGYAMNITTSEGYGGDINLAIGVSNDGTLTGMQIISQSETAGLGANCTKPKFMDQFAGIKSETVVSTKTGKSAPNEVDAISSASFTTGAVVGAVNAGLSFAYGNCLK